jgi:thiol-disulfide isomerase/thioredoxin
MKSSKFLLPIVVGVLVLGFAVFIGARTFQFPNMQARPEAVLKTVPGNLKISGLSKTVELSAFEGKVVVLNFWATWCPPCVSEMPHFVAISNAYPKDVVVIGISLDEETAPVHAFLKKHKITYPVGMMNDAFGDTFGALPGIPATFILDRKLQLVKKVVGYQSFSDVDALIKPYL